MLVRYSVLDLDVQIRNACFPGAWGRTKAGVSAQSWWRLRDKRRGILRPGGGRPGSHFEDGWEDVPAHGPDASSEGLAEGDRRPAGDVLVKVELLDPTAGEDAGGGGGAGPAGPRLFVCVREAVLPRRAVGGGGELFCVVELQALSRQHVFAACGPAVLMYDPRTGRREAGFPGSRPPEAVEAHRRRVTCVAAARVDGRDLLFSGSIDGVVIVWDVFSGESASAPRHASNRPLHSIPRTSPPSPDGARACPFCAGRVAASKPRVRLCVRRKKRGPAAQRPTVTALRPAHPRALESTAPSAREPKPAERPAVATS